MTNQRLLNLETHHRVRLMREQLTYSVIASARGAYAAVTLAVILALTVSFVDVLGPVAPRDAATFVAVVAAWSICATICVKAYTRRPVPDRAIPRWHWTFTALYAANGIAWGTAAYLLWAPDNPINQITLMTLCVLSIANAANEHGESFRFVSAVALGNAVVTASAFLVQTTTIGQAVFVLLPTGFIWYAFMALHARRRFCDLVLTRLHNEDLVEEAAAARDEALVLQARAESASNAKSAFLANMSHELRTPLNAIIGFAQIVRDELFGPLNNARYKDYLTDIEGSGQHLLGIINDILDIAKIESGKTELNCEWVPPDSVIEDAVRVVIGQADQRDIRIAMSFAHRGVDTHVDARMMCQSVINLLSNAVKHTPDGEEVTISTLLTENGRLRVVVADRGAGVPDHMLDQVFEAFEQADNSYAREKQGTGLGLALVKAFIGAHHGRVWLEQREGGGTLAIIELPHVRYQANPTGRAAA